MSENTSSNSKPDRAGSNRQKYCGKNCKDLNGHVKWSGGILLIATGALLLLQNFGFIMFIRAWALLILIPAIAAFATARQDYKKAGKRFSEKVFSSLIGGLILTLVTIVLLFNLSWQIIGPVILLVVGFSVLSRNTIVRKKTR